MIRGWGALFKSMFIIPQSTVGRTLPVVKKRFECNPGALFRMT